MSKLSPCLWFDGQAEEAAEFYTKLLPDSHIDNVSRAAADNPSGKKGDVLTVNFTLRGVPFVGLNGGPDFKFNEAISFVIDCEDQAEVDRYWDASSRAVASTARAAGSRTASACRGRSSRSSCTRCSADPIRPARSVPWRQCSRCRSWTSPTSRPRTRGGRAVGARDATVRSVGGRPVGGLRHVRPAYHRRAA